MNARVEIPTDAAPLMAAHGVALLGVWELADLLCAQAEALQEAAEVGDVAAVEARLWTCRHVLKAACLTWREAVPALPSNKGGARG